jgi:hypothetical protein
VIGYIASLSVLLVATAFVLGVRAGILATLLLHPVAASGWYANYFLGGIKMNPLVLMGLIVPMFIFLRAFTRGPSFAKMPLAGIWTVYLCYNLFAGTFHAIDEGPAKSMDLIFRHIAGFVGFYMIQAFFTEKKDFKRLLLTLVASGLFPVLVILYQIATGSGTLREMSEGGDLRLDDAYGLTRYSGFYHDIVSVRGYVFQCLAGIILYWAYFIRPNRDVIWKVMLGGLSVACVFVLYKMYSKAAIGTMILWFGIWCVGYRKIGLAIVLCLLVVGINALHSDLIFSETGQLFQVELSEATEGSANVDSRRLLSGRVGVWQHALAQFGEATAIEQMFGFRSAGGAHNDYLQKLFYGGFVGLTIYLLLLWMIGVRVLKLYMQPTTPINLMAAMIFGGWLIDTIGVVPSLYPGYQWYAWGMIGLAIKGLEFEPEAGSAAGRLPVQRPLEALVK